MKREQGILSSPLGLISMFLTFSETTLGVAVTQTTSWIQAVLTIFVVVFPIVIFATFMLILWLKPGVFYPPHLYGKKTGVTEYAKALHSSYVDINLTEWIKNIINDGLTSESTKLKLEEALNSEKNNSTIDTILEVFRDGAEEVARKNIIQIEMNNGDMVSKTWDYFYLPNMNIQSFLDRILVPISHKIPPYSYGKRWVLKDKTGKVFDDVGEVWAHRNNKTHDDRTIQEAGIQPSETLEIIELSP